MNDQRVSTITVKELHELAARQPVEIIDVRTPEEFQAVRAPGVRLITLNDLDPAALVDSRKLPAHEPIYFICHSGGRSEWACMAMMAAGHANVANVVGGTSAWEAAGLPVERG